MIGNRVSEKTRLLGELIVNSNVTSIMPSKPFEGVPKAFKRDLVYASECMGLAGFLSPAPRLLGS